MSNLTEAPVLIIHVPIAQVSGWSTVYLGLYQVIVAGLTAVRRYPDLSGESLIELLEAAVGSADSTFIDIDTATEVLSDFFGCPVEINATIVIGGAA